MKQFNFLKVALLVLIVAVSFTSCTEVDNGFKGVVYKPYSGGLDPAQVYPEGVDIGVSWLWNDMITYDCRQHTTNIAAELLDKNNLAVTVEASILYRVQANNIGKLHLDKGITYESDFIRPISQGALMNVVGRYTAQELISKREQVQKEIKEILVESFATNNLNCDDIIIRDINLPKSINNAITAKQVQEEKNLTSEKFKVEQQNIAAAQEATAIGNRNAAKFNAEAQKLLSRPDLLELKRIEVLETYASKGISPFGTNNVFDKASVSLFLQK